MSNSFSTQTNIQFGSTDLKDVWFYAQSCGIPGIQFAPMKVGGRGGVQLNMAPDTATYTDLTIDMPIEKDWSNYNAIYQHFLESINVDKGTFASRKFDMWLDIYNTKGKKIKQFWFYGCLLNDISEIQVDVSDNDDTIMEVSLTFQFDYMDMDNSFFKSRNS